ncbi:MAG: ATP-binding protein, partial [Desulfobacterota bacterium]|nr:ATP-binding protein [Thermodesulfobacteriota bacterium]
KNVIDTIVPRKESTGRDLVAMIANICQNPDAHAKNENENICSDGRRIWISWSNHGLRDDSGTVVEILSVGNDITEKKQAEQRLHMLATAVENASDHIVITDAQGIIQYVNKATCTASGVPAEEIIGHNFFFPQVKTSTPTTLLEDIWATVSSGKVWSGQLLNRTRTGTDMVLEAVITPVKNQSGAVVNYVSVSRNKTRENQLEQQLHNAQKMEALGTLAGGIAHDFNNILAGIIGYIEVAKDELPANSPIHHHLNNVLALSDRAADLVKQILTFSRKRVGERSIITMNDILKEALDLLRLTTPASIQIVANIAEQPCTVYADPTQMLQLVMNLCTNAVNAMENKSTGTLTISLSTETLSAEDAMAYHHITPGEYVMLRVSDTGKGIAPDIIDKIFDPFFTTKEIGKGTGLGLSVVHGIVKEHGGAIRVESTLGKGSLFTIVLPLARHNHAVQCKKEPDVATLFKGTGKILFVDDEESLTDTYRQMLERLGYTVTTAHNGTEAWKLFSDRPASFDIIITDQTMPGMSGCELVKKIKQIRPDIPIILCTGYAEWVTPDPVAYAGIAAFLEKPVPITTMERNIRALLTRQRAASR